MTCDNSVIALMITLAWWQLSDYFPDGCSKIISNGIWCMCKESEVNIS